MSSTAGHIGIAKTIARVYYWLGIFREVARYVRRCANYILIRHKIAQIKPAGTTHATIVA